MFLNYRQLNGRGIRFRRNQFAKPIRKWREEERRRGEDRTKESLSVDRIGKQNERTRIRCSLAFEQHVENQINIFESIFASQNKYIHFTLLYTFSVGRIEMAIVAHPSFPPIPPWPLSFPTPRSFIFQ